MPWVIARLSRDHAFDGRKSDFMLALDGGAIFSICSSLLLRNGSLSVFSATRREIVLPLISAKD